MSILFRTMGWLTVNQLARAWAGELPGAEKEPKRFEQELGTPTFGGRRQRTPR
jgi:hypothetical protein